MTSEKKFDPENLYSERDDNIDYYEKLKKKAANQKTKRTKRIPVLFSEEEYKKVMTFCFENNIKASPHMREWILKEASKKEQKNKKKFL